MKAPIRVCFPFVGDAVGGAHLSTLLLIEGLDRQRYVPEIVLHREGPLSEHLEKRGFSYEILPITRFAGNTPHPMAIASAMLRAWRPLWSFIRKRNIGIVHANDLRINLTWVLAARTSGARMVWHQRTTPMSSSLVWKAVPYLVNRCIAISRAAGAVLGAGGPRCPVLYNPFHVDVVPDREEARQRMRQLIGAASGEPILGFVARLVPFKRPDLCVDIAAQVQSMSGKRTHLVFIGADTAKMRIALEERAASFNVEAHFLGFRYPVEPDLAGFDVLLAPSEIEGFGRALVESALVSTPVVASSVGGHLEIIVDGKTGFLVPAGDAASFADRVMRLLTDTALARSIGAEAREEARQRFSASVHVGAVQALYDKMMLSA